MPAAQFAVFGHPISHSLSPRIQQAFAQQFGIALEYRTIDAAPAQFDAAVRRFFDGVGVGANVTLPHKASAFALADEHSLAARRAGTANVLTRLADGRLAAHNTDGAGLLRDLTERHRVDLRGQHVLLLGAGGAAHGVAWPLLDAGVRALTVVNRSRAAADALAEAIGAPASSCNSASTRAAVCAKSPDRRDSTWRSIEMPRRSIRASTVTSGRSKVS